MFAKIGERKDTHNTQCKISYLEIYNESIIDLLSDNPGVPLDVRENQSEGIHIPGLEIVPVMEYGQAMQLYEKGESNRKVGETASNSQSSRSHTIFRVQIQSSHKRNITESVKDSTINLIDLAGSEAMSKALTQGIRLKEGNNINKSLLALSNVIVKLSQKNAFINFRDSKLTRLLQQQLSGNSKTVLICTINTDNYNETMNTLKFGLTASKIKMDLKQNSS